jgi:hypothetical protein
VEAHGGECVFVRVAPREQNFAGLADVSQCGHIILADSKSAIRILYICAPHITPERLLVPAYVNLPE